MMIMVVIAAAAGPAQAAGDDAQPAQDPTGILNLQQGTLLPLTSGAAHPYAAVITSFGGYDSARQAGVLDVATEIKLFGPLSIRGGVSYLSDQGTMKPSLGLVGQFLDQEHQGVSASFGVFYKPEGLTELEGEIEGVLALSRVIDRTTLALNLVYGQDGEGTERDGEVRFAVLQRIGATFLGFDSRLRFAIGDPKNMEPKLDFIAGPLVSYGFAEYAATVQVGVSLINVTGTQTGAIALAGLARAF